MTSFLSVPISVPINSAPHSHSHGSPGNSRHVLTSILQYHAAADTQSGDDCQKYHH